MRRGRCRSCFDNWDTATAVVHFCDCGLLGHRSIGTPVVDTLLHWRASLCWTLPVQTRTIVHDVVRDCGLLIRLRPSLPLRPLLPLVALPFITLLLPPRLITLLLPPLLITLMLPAAPHHARG